MILNKLIQKDLISNIYYIKLKNTYIYINMNKLNLKFSIYSNQKI